MLNFDPKNKEWVINRIKDVIAEVLKVGTDSMTIDELATKQDELAGLNALLGSYASQAYREADFAYIDRKIAFANQWNPTKQAMIQSMDTKPTVQDIETGVTKKIEDQMREEIEKKHEADGMKILWDSTQQVLNSWASTIRVKNDAITRH